MPDPDNALYAAAGCSKGVKQGSKDPVFLFDTAGASPYTQPGLNNAIDNLRVRRSCWLMADSFFMFTCDQLLKKGNSNGIKCETDTAGAAGNFYAQACAAQGSTC
jgi:hypothetical protein